MIIEKLQDKTGFTDSEKLIADYVLNHLEEVQRLTATQLAKETLTSKSSIIRFCKKLGLTGYQELKIRTFSEISMQGRMMQQNDYLILNEKSKYSDYVQNLNFLYADVLAKMQEQLNHNSIKRILNKLKHMERIDFYSFGLGHSIGAATAHRYGGLGIESNAYSSINEGFLLTNKNNNKTAAFVITLSGKNPSIIHISKELKKYGIYVVGIVGTPSKELEQNCDEMISMALGKFFIGAQHMAIVLSTNYILDLFYMGLLANRYEKQKTLIQKITSDLEKF